jgi:bifunctional enzyme CysN/CysC
VLVRNYKWIKSAISKDRRAEKYSQKASLILITGEKGAKRKEIAKDLEQTLFDDGKFVYYLGIGNILYGVDADIKEEGKDTNRKEHLRRMAEVAHIMLDSGTILIITAVQLLEADVETIKAIVDEELIETVWVGSDISTDIKPDLHITEFNEIREATQIIKSRLQEKGVIFKPF